MVVETKKLLRKWYCCVICLFFKPNLIQITCDLLFQPIRRLHLVWRSCEILRYHDISPKNISHLKSKAVNSPTKWSIGWTKFSLGLTYPTHIISHRKVMFSQMSFLLLVSGGSNSPQLDKHQSRSQEVIHTGGNFAAEIILLFTFVGNVANFVGKPWLMAHFTHFQL